MPAQECLRRPSGHFPGQAATYTVAVIIEFRDADWLRQFGANSNVIRAQVSLPKEPGRLR
jgi:hypothetical protein